MATTKVLTKGAFCLDSSTSPGDWMSNVNSLGAGNCFPYINLGTKKVINHEEDPCISCISFKDTARLTGTYVEDSISTYLRLKGISDLLYWMFGMEHAPVLVDVVRSSTSGTYVNGDEYEDESNNSFTLIRTEKLKSGVYQYIFSCDDDLAINGDLSRVSGTGVPSIDVSSSSGILYEHLFELDAWERHQAEFRDVGAGRYDPDVGELSELSPDNARGNAYTAGNLKCRRAIIGKKLATGDFQFPGAMCKKFSIQSEAGKMATISGDYVARAKEDSDTSSDTWTLKSELVTNDNVLGHHDFQVCLDETDDVENDNIGVINFNLDVEIPLKVEQDTISGLLIEEPVFEGLYGLNLKVILSRHATDKYEDFRDAWDSICARIEAHVGYEKLSLLIENAKLSNAGPNDEEVAKEELDFVIGTLGLEYLAGNPVDNGPFVDNALFSHKNINRSPVLLLVRNSDANQYMNKY